VSVSERVNGSSSQALGRARGRCLDSGSAHSWSEEGAFEVRLRSLAARIDPSRSSGFARETPGKADSRAATTPKPPPIFFLFCPISCWHKALFPFWWLQPATMSPKWQLLQP